MPEEFAGGNARSSLSFGRQDEGLEKLKNYSRFTKVLQRAK